MIKRLLLFVYLVTFLCVGYAADIDQSTADEKESKVLKSVDVVWDRSRHPFTKIKGLDFVKANLEIQDLLESMRNNVPANVQIFLRGKGIDEGDKAKIFISPTEVSWNDSAMTANLDVSLERYDLPIESWEISVYARSPVMGLGKSIDESLSDQIIEKLVKAGFVGTK